MTVSKGGYPFIDNYAAILTRRAEQFDDAIRIPLHIPDPQHYARSFSSQKVIGSSSLQVLTLA
jgi:hypothetical protein